MHATSLRTIWLVLLTSMTLIASSMASSKRLMPIQMLQMSQSTSNHCDADMLPNMDMATMSHHLADGQQTSINMDCSNGNSMQHECCDTTCVTVFATLTDDLASFTPSFDIQTYPIEPTRDTVAITSSLYRPPSA
ncbi:hypothetical protein BIY21_12350 [Vibrio ponticus]|uniref:DUF2946 domain-containing protein n=1 Tax=Vibrio ponticus TaxID=265668 RepID=A0ABX3FGB9_9VIBR|nr:hypothetical protein [Vibrio ponticus]OLQ92221.1 hypothetical protein BIY21_12350 [Vibrio ponticus]